LEQIELRDRNLIIAVLAIV